ncbi:hypothetical protein QTI66_30745 [Variovorax sp. J22R133]|uniref:hypothetical protein n=1 Tax=Variovorax brevis TaxID=3053503 RepID=UPI002574B736|nr:hypothetical protein [Variovorax sp. J22R133]MDM0116528.1 hypothetical protein [Variovorax sp. J22R133]
MHTLPPRCSRLPWPNRPRAGLAGALLMLVCTAVAAGTTTVSGLGTPAVAELKFAININRFVYLRIGSATAVDPPVSFALTPSIPGAPGGTVPVPGGPTSVNWNGAAPVFSVAPSNNALPVEVRSNVGSVTLRANTVLPLKSGSNIIPMSQITVQTSDSTLSAPLLPDAGTSATSTTVSGNAFGNSYGNLVTWRKATWTFGYAPTPAQLPRAGDYTGQVTFTASAP